MTLADGQHSNSYRMKKIYIEALEASDFDSFAFYLNDHLSDNGTDSTGYFQPISRDKSRLSSDRSNAFLEGLKTPLGTPPWRRVWVARNSINEIVGHVDLRAYSEQYVTHRCVLGLGVDRNHRKQGVGLELLQAAQSWAINFAKLEWIDLQVLSSNHAAIHVYSRFGFKKVGEIPEMFKIDGSVFSFTTMTLKLTEPKQSSCVH